MAGSTTCGCGCGNITNRGPELPRLLALYGGDIITMDPARPRTTALLAFGDRIQACGTDAEIRAAYELHRGMPGTGPAEAIDLRGRAVVPGLIDSHLHLLWYGFFLQQVDLNGTTSIDDLRRRVQGRAATVPVGQWVTGSGWQQDFLAEKRMPTRADLDAVAPEHPVMLHRVCYHAVACNSLALRIGGVTRDTPDPDGGVIDRDPATGEPTGILRERAAELVARHIPEPTPAQMVEALRLACWRASAAGLTSVHTNDGQGEAIGAYVALRDAGQLTVRAYHDTSYPRDEVLLGLPAGFGDEWVKIGAVKLFVDGSLGARTAALRSPYSDDPAASGVLMHTPENLNVMVRKAHDCGRQVAVHAIGDRAVALALDAIEAAVAANPRADHRHRIVHAQALAPDLIPRLAQARVVVDIQPKFTTGELFWAPDRLGPERVPYSYCWRTMLEAGVRCAGGSDCPVEPLEPLWGIYAAVTRSAMDGQRPEGWLPQEKLDPLTAVKLFTLDAAYGAFEEHIKGSLEPGKLADLVVLDRAPDRVAPHEIKDLTVEMTVVGGRTVYERG
ncbi:MAG: amidohydrolase [Bacillota bacterium]|nr:amidohydrolase [Bacillota bacterium]